MSRRWLAEHFEVSVRTVERDIAGLQQAAVPIWSQPGPEGGYGIDAAHTLPPLNLTALEATAVAVALAAAGDAPYAFHARTAAAKVAAVLTSTGAHPDTAARIRVTPSPPPGPPEVVAAVERAVTEGRVVELSYRDREGRTSRRQVECHGLYRSVQDWYVVGWCRLRDGGRLFRLDRIVTIEVLAERIVERDLDAVLGWVPGSPERPSLVPLE